MSSEISSFGFIGLGNMGWPMAYNLRKGMSKSATLHVYDIVPSICERFCKEVPDENGVVVTCSNAREVAEKSDLVFVIVPEGHHVRDVFLSSETGILTGVVSGKTFVDCSTIDPGTSLLVAKSVAASSARFYDAPVSGGTAGAQAASLTFMVGASAGTDPFVESTLEPILKMMGANIFYLGGASLGLVAKLSNNYLSGIIAIATSEAMNIGMKYGIDPKVLSDCFRKSSGGNWVNDTVNPVPGVCPEAVTSRGYRGGFKVQLMKKDFGLAVDSAKQVGARLVLGDAGLATYTAASEDESCRDLDSRVVYRWLGGQE